MTYPKSCLKRGSISSIASDCDSIASTSPQQPHGVPEFALAEPCTSLPTASTSSSSLPSTSSDTDASRPRRKSVTFCEDDDVHVFHPHPTPLHKQAKRAASRLFRACADALRIEPYQFPDDEDYMQHEDGWSSTSPESSCMHQEEESYASERPRFLTAFANVHIDGLRAAFPR
ncbi:hypothetical protein L226DRAFT_383672 [Lentinus tigrinus ALCF2SS1-7]|uniref:Uncharacterized protein n=1 Tax=Lentinus tigrinus ALCF2SS1-6 TaxID=1328759 RepID=A0A5C2SN20_9APHY|nr:hypothetical protein L227DRAFT_608148 [Lentinus tigrinus ALCF2SS1-6]RPD76700.1 hypothetical protein L226DRAFT_383672 [Lentinus tigrinus ALCF2SS1-7]